VRQERKGDVFRNLPKISVSSFIALPSRHSLSSLAPERLSCTCAKKKTDEYLCAFVLSAKSPFRGPPSSSCVRVGDRITPCVVNVIRAANRPPWTQARPRLRRMETGSLEMAVMTCVIYGGACHRPTKLVISPRCRPGPPSRHASAFLSVSPQKNGSNAGDVCVHWPVWQGAVFSVASCIVSITKIQLALPKSLSA